jgi:transposase
MQRTAAHDHPGHAAQGQPQGAASVRFRADCERNLVKRFFNLLKHFRAVAARNDKLARNSLAGVRLAVTIFAN